MHYNMYYDKKLQASPVKKFTVTHAKIPTRTKKYNSSEGNTDLTVQFSAVNPLFDMHKH